ncbi:MAG: SMI1/KNR4 family protein [Pseudomonadota bacterium]
MKNWFKFTAQVAKKFPALSSSLNAKAAPAEIDALEQRFGHPLPQALRELYQTTNGEQVNSPGIIFGLRFLPVSEVRIALDQWQEIIDGGLDGMNDDCTSKPKAAIQCVYANKSWLPLFSDSGGNYIGLDFDPAPKGTLGQVINFGRDEENKHVLAKDLDTFINQLAKLVGWNVVHADGNGGFAVNDMHFIDAIKSIKKLPSKNPDAGYYSIWLFLQNKNTIPTDYFAPNNGGASGKSLIEDFNIQWNTQLSYGGSALASGEPAPLSTLLRHLNRSDKYADALLADAGKRGITEAGYLHFIADFNYVLQDGVAADACATFIGCYNTK